MKKLVIFLLIGLGAFFGVVWYFDVEQTGGSFSDFFNDPIGGTTSLFSRFGLWVGGLYQSGVSAVGGQADPIAMAAGLIAGFEGFSPSAYADPPGQTSTYSIGYGHQIVPGDGFTTASTISEGDALALLQQDIQTYATCVTTYVTAPLAPEQEAALISLCYNIGCTAFQNSTLVGNLNGPPPDYDGAAEQFSVWDMAGGQVSSTLQSRRAKEQALFSSVSAPNTTASPDDTQVASSQDDSGDDNGEDDDGDDS